MFSSFKSIQAGKMNIFILVSFFFIQILWFFMGGNKTVDLSGTSLFNYFKIGFGQFPYFCMTNILLLSGFFLFISKTEFIFKQVSAFIFFQITFLLLSTYHFSATFTYIIECSFSLSAAFLAIENLVANKLKNPRIVEAGIFGMLSGISLSAEIRELGISFMNVTGSLTVFTIGVLMAEIAITLFSYFFLIKLLEKNDQIKKPIYTFLNFVTIVIALYLAANQIFF